MIRYLTHTAIDKEKWDNCIDQSFNSLPYAYSWYLDIAHKSWDALIEDDYERVMPLTTSKKWGLSYWYQPFFVQQLGVFSKGILNAEIVAAFLSQIPKSIKYVDIKLNSLNQLNEHHKGAKWHKNHLLDLIYPYDKLKTNYNTNTKRNLKKAGKSDLSLMKNIRPEDVVKLFRENRGATLEKWADAHYQTLNRLMYAAIHKGMGTAYGVYTSTNELCAAAYFIKTRDRLIFLFSGTNNLAKETAAMTFLLDGVIAEYAKRQMVLDFEGSDDENLARFYKGFGSSEVHYPGICFSRMGTVLNFLYELYKKSNRKKYH